MNEEIITKKNINVIVYHIYCVNHYKSLVKRQLNSILDSGLYDFIDRMEVTCSDPNGIFEGIDELFEGLDKVNIHKININQYEYPALKKVWDLSQKYDGKVFYLHTKGVANKLQYGNEHIKDKKDILSAGDRLIEWFEYFLIKNWKDCVNALDEYDSCGLTCVDYWWWGNFWWSNLSWIKNNEEPKKPINADRWYYEAWVNIHRNPRPKTKEFFRFTFSNGLSKLPNDFHLYDNWFRDKKVKIISAEYGYIGIMENENSTKLEKNTIDFTDVVIENLEKNDNKKIHIVANNSKKGNPNGGHELKLIVYLECENENYYITTQGNMPLIINFE